MPERARVRSENQETEQVGELKKDIVKMGHPELAGEVTTTTTTTSETASPEPSGDKDPAESQNTTPQLETNGNNPAATNAQGTSPTSTNGSVDSQSTINVQPNGEPAPTFARDLEYWSNLMEQQEMEAEIRAMKQDSLKVFVAS
ncbi:hypothetical protein ABW19_dt0207198 [Dactylella cylindrospora]|nr:hypothetical protein ABW19_dt0207198 [Dactylella cylindrospora]